MRFSPEQVNQRAPILKRPLQLLPHSGTPASAGLVGLDGQIAFKANETDSQKVDDPFIASFKVHVQRQYPGDLQQSGRGQLSSCPACEHPGYMIGHCWKQNADPEELWSIQQSHLYALYLLV